MKVCNIMNGSAEVSEGMVIAGGNAHVLCESWKEPMQIILRDQATCDVGGHATVVASGRSTVRAQGHVMVFANDDCTLEASGVSRFYASHRSTVVARDHADGLVFDMADLICKGHSTAQVQSEGNITVCEGGTVTCLDASREPYLRYDRWTKAKLRNWLTANLQPMGMDKLSAVELARRSRLRQFSESVEAGRLSDMIRLAGISEEIAFLLSSVGGHKTEAR